MNELLVIAWLLLPASALLIQYYLIQKRQNLLWILPLLSLAVTFFIACPQIQKIRIKTKMETDLIL